jgi:hypothetical protein
MKDLTYLKDRRIARREANQAKLKSGIRETPAEGSLGYEEPIV